MRKKATKKELAHMRLIKTFPCVVCDPGWYKAFDDGHRSLDIEYETICEYDHLVDGNRLGHMYGIPLCKAHHLGKKRHAGGIPWDSSKPNQWRLMEKVYKVLDKEIPEYNPKGRNNFKEPI